MEKLTVDDVLLQTLVTLINLGARKAGLAAPPGEEPPKRDLEQTRQAIDGARALLPLLEPRHGAGARPDQGRAVAPADGLRAALRRHAAGRGSPPSRAPKPGEPGPGADVRAALGPRAVAAFRRPRGRLPRSAAARSGLSFRFV